MKSIGKILVDSVLENLIHHYAEVHYRFPFFPFSCYYKKEPEIIFDTVHRIEKNKPLPVFLIIKDSDRFPVELKHVLITVKGSDSFIRRQYILNEKLEQFYWGKEFLLDIQTIDSDQLTVDCRLTFKTGRKLKSVRQDNYAGLSKRPFDVIRASLPAFDGWKPGDIHCHTSYGNDHVEFGAFPDCIATAAQSMGLHWAALTDHSYDLDDMQTDYLTNDPDLKKWQQINNEITNISSSQNGFILIPGEEVTCRSNKGKNFHLLVLNNKAFLEGSGDSAEQWFRTKSENSLKEILETLEPEALAIAAHPFSSVSILERLLLNRGSWKTRDLLENNLTGWQVWNGINASFIEKIMMNWIKSLQNGEKKYIYGGNDSHGNFNRYRQIGFPMLNLKENIDHLFGKVFTSVYAGNSANKNKITENLSLGKCFISNGPVIDFFVTVDGKRFEMGELQKVQKTGSINLEIKSNEHFGKIEKVKILTCNNGDEIDLIAEDFKLKKKSRFYELSLKIPLRGKKYIRAETETQNSSSKLFKAISNPIWIQE